jgi:hypothetical protein
MNYGDLDEVYGGAFQKRVPITDQSRKDPLEKPLESTVGPNQAGLAQAVRDAMRGANIDNTRNTEGFQVYEEQPAQIRQQVREKFTQSQPAGVSAGTRQPTNSHDNKSPDVASVRKVPVRHVVEVPVGRTR